MTSDNTPVLIGSGQTVVRHVSAPEEAAAPAQLAASAARRALDDAGVDNLAESLDTVAVTRLYTDSIPGFVPPFGRCDNLPLSVARRIGASPSMLLYGEVGGHSPQRFVNEMAESIFAGETQLALLCGAEATAAMKLAARNQWSVDWSEDIGGDLEDRGIQLIQTGLERAHHITYPPQVYALLENAWRHRKGMSVPQHRALAAKVLARFSSVAAANPYAQFPQARDEAFLATPSAKNYELNIPHTKWLVAQDAVNQGAAVVMTSIAKATALGIPHSRWVFLHGYADADDVYVSHRPDLATSYTLTATSDEALSMAQKTASDVALLDLYSCFPIAVFAACDALGIDPDTETPLTVTGGLPFFGGAGNNYSLHAIAEMCSRLRQTPGQFGFVSANGGYLSKQSVGIYSTEAPTDWQPRTTNQAQQTVDRQTNVEVINPYDGKAVIESYSVVYHKGKPGFGFVVARTHDSDCRVLAKVAQEDSQTLRQLMQKDDPIGSHISVHSDQQECYFRMLPH